MNDSYSRRPKYAAIYHPQQRIDPIARSPSHKEVAANGLRTRPKRLAEKLLTIRTALGLSQAELHKRLGVEEDISYTRISDYELGKNEPSLIVLLEYARIAGVHLEEIVR